MDYAGYVVIWTLDADFVAVYQHAYLVMQGWYFWVINATITYQVVITILMEMPHPAVETVRHVLTMPLNAHHARLLI